MLRAWPDRRLYHYRIKIHRKIIVDDIKVIDENDLCEAETVREIGQNLSIIY